MSCNWGRRAFLAAAGWILAAPLCHASLIIAVQSVTGAAGTTGDKLQVTLSNTGASQIIGGFSFGLSVGTTNLTFTAVDDSTTDAYIFGTDSLFGPDISVQPPNLPGQTLEAEDIDSAGSVTVAAGATVGLGDVIFSLSSLAPPGPIAVSQILALDSLSDQNGDSLAFTTSNGTVTIPGTVVPEPAPGPLMGIALLALVGARAFGHACRTRPGGR